MSEKSSPPVRVRSALFVPADKPRAIEKAASLSAEALILDMEDAVAPKAKDTARADIPTAVKQWQATGKMAALRVNGVGSEAFKKDLVAVGSQKPDAVVIPKADSPDILQEARLALSGKGYHGPLWAMIETPMGVLNLRAIAEQARHLNITTLIAGTNDLAFALGAQVGVGRSALIPHLTQIVLTARAYGLIALDGVYNDFSDTDGLTTQSRAGKVMGFHGKTAIHPSQIDVINTAFAPSKTETDWARAVVEAFENPTNKGKGAVNVNGEMAERMHYQQAMAILAQI